MRFKGFFALSSAVLLLGLIIAGWVYYGFAQPASAPADESTISQSNDTATKPGKKVTTPTPSTGSAPVTYKITEAEATAQANAYLASSGFPLDLSDLQIHFQNERVQATANVKISGFGVPVAAQAVVDVRDGKPVVTVQKVDVGGLGAPEAVRQQIRDVLEKGLDQALPKDLPLVFDDITMANGVMTVSGHEKRRQW